MVDIGQTDVGPIVGPSVSGASACAERSTSGSIPTPYLDADHAVRALVARDRVMLPLRRPASPTRAAFSTNGCSARNGTRRPPSGATWVRFDVERGAEPGAFGDVPVDVLELRRLASVYWPAAPDSTR